MTETLSLLIATHNRGKVRELNELLSDLPVQLRSLAELPHIGEAEETGQTFTENALLKARYYAERSGLWALADDSGLEVDALGGAPGVLSARYAGPDASDTERIERLLDELAATGDTERRARFVCVIALGRSGEEPFHTFKGTCEGRIAHAPRGQGGFGYDPVFIPLGHTQSFGELPPEVKHGISHRARALAQARQFLSRMLSRRLT